MSGAEVIFEVNDDELDGGYSASAVGFGIHTEGETLHELRRNIMEAVDSHFEDSMEPPATDPASLRARLGSGGVKVPSDVDGAVFVSARRRPGYGREHQDGSHVRVTTRGGSGHREVIPLHDPNNAAVCFLGHSKGDAPPSTGAHGRSRGHTCNAANRRATPPAE